MFPLTKVFAFLMVSAMFVLEARRGTFQGARSYLRSRIRSDLIRIGCFLVLTVPILFFDSVLLRTIQSWEAPFLPYVAEYGGLLGRKSWPWIVMAAIYGTGTLVKNKVWSRISFGCLLSSALAATTGFVFKFLSMRNRPADTDDPFSFFNLTQSVGELNLAQSFPSGDVTVVAGACGFLFFHVKPLAWKMIFLILPLTCGYSRMMLNKHWPSDVFFALALGFLAGSVVFSYQKERNPI